MDMCASVVWVDTATATNNKFIIIGNNKVYEINQGTRHAQTSLVKTCALGAYALLAYIRNMAKT